MHQLIINSPLSNHKTKTVDQMVTNVEPKNNLEHIEISLNEKTHNQFPDMTVSSSSNTSESGNFVSKLFIFHLNIIQT